MISSSVATEFFSSLNEKDQLRFLVHFAYELTIRYLNVNNELIKTLTNDLEPIHAVVVHVLALLSVNIFSIAAPNDSMV